MEYERTPVQPLFKRAGVTLAVKREDMNHPAVSGNKWWKLKYNLREAKTVGAKTLLTVGGAYSNHIYATAAAARELGFDSIGVIRGEPGAALNPTLQFAQQQGMQLHFVSRENYRQKSDRAFLEALKKKYGNFYYLPEGGTNAAAVKGCEEMGKMLVEEIDFDILCLPVGTGGTIAGLVNAMPGKKIMGFSALKGGSFLNDEVRKYLTVRHPGWQIIDYFHFGGYGKVTGELKTFILDFEKQYSIPLDPVYTGKMMFGVMKLTHEGYFPEGSKVLILHTGGLQGRKGFSF